jgi:hypothetical protein
MRTGYGYRVRKIAYPLYPAGGESFIPMGKDLDLRPHALRQSLRMEPLMDPAKGAPYVHAVDFACIALTF